MNIILLSGGSGKRLWPLSNDIRSKQFIKIFKKATPKHYEELEDIKAVKDYEDTGNTEAAKELYESMVQRIYRQIKKADPDSIITIATSKSQVSSLHNQLGFDIDISVEPTRRDTFAAIALAVAYLHDVKGISSSEAVVVCPVDPYVDETYFDCLKKLYEKAQEGNRKLILMGIEATYPSEKYGYIKPTCPSIEHIEPTEYTEQNFRQQQSGQQQDKILGTTLRTWSFTEKPTKEKAEEYIESGALWNGGVFAFKLNYILEKSRELLGTDDYETLRGNYSKLKKISFDYAVVEQETSIDVVKYSGMWKDLGTWNTLTEAMEENSIGDAIITDTCENVHVVNELDVPVVATGLKNVIVSASPEGILVSDKEQSSFIKPIVDSFDQQVMFADKSWGTYRVLDVGESSLTIKVVLKAKEHMNYHSHSHRDAIGAGCLIAEIQESSNVTYRLYDYDRVDKTGKKRQLHVEKALDVVNLKSSLAPRQPMRVLKYKPAYASELLARCRYFQVERIILNTEVRRNLVSFQTGENSFHVLLCVDGCGSISGVNINNSGFMLNFFKGDCVFIPAKSEILKLHGRAQLLDVSC